MTKALTIIPKISHAYPTTAKTARVSAELASCVPKPKTSKATKGLVGNILYALKTIAQKIAKSPETAVSQMSKSSNFPAHKDPAAIVMRTIRG